MTSPAFAGSIGMSGSQFRYVRARMANPSIELLAKVSRKLETPLYELLEGRKLGRRLDLSARQMTKRLAANLREKLEESGVEKAAFAEAIGVSLPQLYVMLRREANPSLLAIVELAKRLDMSIWELLGVEGN